MAAPAARNESNVTYIFGSVAPMPVIEGHPKSEKDVTSLKKDGAPKKAVGNNKKKGVSSRVEHIHPNDVPKILNYLMENELWYAYLEFVLELNTARRVIDILNLKWGQLIDVNTGKVKERFETKEKKTSKLATPFINKYARDAIELFIRKVKVDPAKNNYGEKVFLQIGGNYAGRTISSSAILKQLKKAAASCGITYNVGTHSARKTFGMLTRNLHPGDPNAMQVLQEILNHSDEKTTRNYIGLTDEVMHQYYDDIGSFCMEYGSGEKEFKPDGKTVVAIEYSDLRTLLTNAYTMGQKNTSASMEEAMAAIQKLLDEAESMIK